MDMRCIKCGHDRVVKHGSVHGIPKYQCNACGYQFTKTTVHDDQKYPLRIKMLAVWLYSSGLSMRRVSRLCQCSTPLVLNWGRDDARQHDEKPSPEGRAVMLEVDDMWHDLKKSLESSGSGTRWIVIQDKCLTGHVGIGINVRSRNCTID